MTGELDDVEVLRECLKTIRSFRKMGDRNGGGTTATEDRISRVLPRILDELERLQADAAAEAAQPSSSVQPEVLRELLRLCKGDSWHECDHPRGDWIHMDALMKHIDSMLTKPPPPTITGRDERPAPAAPRADDGVDEAIAALAEEYGDHAPGRWVSTRDELLLNVLRLLAARRGGAS